MLRQFEVFRKLVVIPRLANPCQPAVVADLPYESFQTRLQQVSLFRHMIKSCLQLQWWFSRFLSRLFTLLSFFPSVYRLFKFYKGELQLHRGQHVQTRFNKKVLMDRLANHWLRKLCSFYGKPTFSH